jgi:hypothetical protein
LPAAAAAGAVTVQGCDSRHTGFIPSHCHGIKQGTAQLITGNLLTQQQQQQQQLLHAAISSAWHHVAESSLAA